MSDSPESRVKGFRAIFDGHAAELLSGAATALGLQVIGAACQFGYYVLLGRLLGTEGTGLYFLSLSVVSFAVVVAGAGLNNATLRFVGAESAAGNWVGVKGVSRRALATVLAFALTITLVVVLTAPWLADRLFDKPALLTPLQWMALGIAPFALGMLLAHMLKGIKRVAAAVTVEKILPVVGSAALFLVVGRAYGSAGATAAYTGGALLTGVLAWILWTKGTPQLRGVTGSFDVRTLYASAAPLYLVALTTWISNWFGVFSLGIWGDTDDVAVFSVAWRTAFLISFVLVAVNAIAAPKFAALHRHGDSAGMQRTARFAVRLGIVAASPLLIVVLLAPDWIMSLFGSEFAQGGLVLVILAITQFVNASAGPVGVLLMMTGNERLVRTIVLVATAVGIGLTLWLVPHYGAVGAAIAYLVSVSLSNVLFIVGVRQRLALRLFAGTTS